MSTILLIEDDETICETLAYLLRNSGYEVTAENDARSGLKRLDSQGADLVLLDAMLPDMSGFDVCRRIRSSHEDIKIIMLTALSERSDIIKGMDTGADDYVTKPFDIDILLARIRAQLRKKGSKSSVGEPETVAICDITVDARSHKVLVGGKDVQLTRKEFDLLALLIKNPGKAFTRRELSALIWNEDHIENSRTIDAHIGNLRHKVERLSGFRFIETVHGFGYRCSVTEK